MKTLKQIGLLLVFLTLAVPGFSKAFDQQIKPLSGIYITKLFNLDYRQGSFDAIFWAWWVYPKTNYKPYDTTEITNASKVKVENKFEDHSSHLIRSEAKYKASIFKAWDLTYFPFDQQTLVIHLEDTKRPYHQLDFTPDTNNSGLFEKAIPGWRVIGFHISSEEQTYKSNFGNSQQDKDSKYSVLSAHVTIKREGMQLFIAYYIGFLIAFSLSLLAFGLRSQLISTRLSLGISALFIAIINNYVLYVTFPHIPILSLTGAIQLITLLTIIISMGASILLYLIGERHRK